jgi:lipid A 4'-phosphatase
MNRTGLIVALGIAAVVGLVFGFFPQLDLAISEPFYRIMYVGFHFGAHVHPLAMIVRDLGLWISTALVAAPLIALALKLIAPQRRMLMPGRAIVLLLSTVILAPGLMANVLLKDHWGRPRPIDVTQFGGDQHFVAWWDPRGECPNNCSFVSGDVSGTAWTVGAAALVPPQWRVLAYCGALALGTGMAAMRVLAGGHFFSDVVFAGVFTFLIIWVMHGLLYRWRTRTTDEVIEKAIEHLSIVRLLQKKKI